MSDKALPGSARLQSIAGKSARRVVSLGLVTTGFALQIWGGALVGGQRPMGHEKAGRGRIGRTYLIGGRVAVHMIATLLAVELSPVVAMAGSVNMPTYDTAKTCRTQVDYAYAATLGDFDIPKEMTACTEREHAQKGSVEALWPLADDKDRSECLDIAEGRYSYLARCLAGSRSVRSARWRS